MMNATNLARYLAQMEKTVSAHFGTVWDLKGIRSNASESTQISEIPNDLKPTSSSF